MDSDDRSNDGFYFDNTEKMKSSQVLRNKVTKYMEEEQVRKSF